jgi:hypothetical protein
MTRPLFVNWKKSPAVLFQTVAWLPTAKSVVFAATLPACTEAALADAS